MIREWTNGVNQTSVLKFSPRLFWEKDIFTESTAHQRLARGKNWWTMYTDRQQKRETLRVSTTTKMYTREPPSPPEPHVTMRSRASTNANTSARRPHGWSLCLYTFGSQKVLHLCNNSYVFSLATDNITRDWCLFLLQISSWSSGWNTLRGLKFMSGPTNVFLNWSFSDANHPNLHERSSLNSTRALSILVAKKSMNRLN